MFNTVINYDFILVGIPPVQDMFLTHVRLLNAFRPSVGGQIYISGKKYIVVRANPSGNPDNVSVTYYVQPFNPDYPYKNGPQKMKLKYRSSSESDNLIYPGA